MKLSLSSSLSLLKLLTLATKRTQYSEYSLPFTTEQQGHLPLLER